MIRALIAGRARVHGEALATALSHGGRGHVLATASRAQHVLALRHAAFASRRERWLETWIGRGETRR
jgi:hypothetical protein